MPLISPIVVEKPQPLGEKGTRFSLDEVARRATKGSRDPRVRAWAIECLEKERRAGKVTRSEIGKSALTRAKIILKACQYKLWVPDPIATEFMAGAHLMTCSDKDGLCFHGEDCDGLQILCGSAMSSVGIPTLIVGHAYDRDKQLSHVLCAVHADGKWHYADPSTEWPLGKRADFTRERVIAIPTGEVICDDDVCVTGSRIKPDVVEHVDAGRFVGVDGPSKSGVSGVVWLTPRTSRVSWLSGSLGAIGLAVDTDGNVDWSKVSGAAWGSAGGAVCGPACAAAGEAFGEWYAENAGTIVDLVVGKHCVDCEELFKAGPTGPPITKDVAKKIVFEYVGFNWKEYLRRVLILRALVISTLEVARGFRDQWNAQVSSGKSLVDILGMMNLAPMPAGWSGLLGSSGYETPCSTEWLSTGEAMLSFLATLPRTSFDDPSWRKTNGLDQFDQPTGVRQTFLICNGSGRCESNLSIAIRPAPMVIAPSVDPKDPATLDYCKNYDGYNISWFDTDGIANLTCRQPGLKWGQVIVTDPFANPPCGIYPPEFEDVRKNWLAALDTGATAMAQQLQAAKKEHPRIGGGGGGGGVVTLVVLGGIGYLVLQALGMIR